VIFGIVLAVADNQNDFTAVKARMPPFGIPIKN